MPQPSWHQPQWLGNCRHSRDVLKRLSGAWMNACCLLQYPGLGNCNGTALRQLQESAHLLGMLSAGAGLLAVYLLHCVPGIWPCDCTVLRIRCVHLVTQDYAAPGRAISTSVRSGKERHTEARNGQTWHGTGYAHGRPHTQISGDECGGPNTRHTMHGCRGAPVAWHVLCGSAQSCSACSTWPAKRKSPVQERVWAWAVGGSNST